MENISTGGYKILDLSAYGPFTVGTSVSVPGVTDFVKSQLTKPILVMGVVLGGVDVPAFFANLRLDTTKGGYVSYYGDRIMTIYTEDRIVFSA